VNEIKRYFFEIGYEAYFPYIHREENEDGDYVLYPDHKQALAQKEAECAGLRERVKELEDMLVYWYRGGSTSDLERSVKSFIQENPRFKNRDSEQIIGG
jgi:hypothetical protein